MNRRGFTLIEVLVATGIFLLSAASFNLAIKTAQRLESQAVEKNREFLGLVNVMEELQSKPFADLSGLNGQTCLAGGGKINISLVEPELAKISLTISKSGENLTSLKVADE